MTSPATSVARPAGTERGLVVERLVQVAPLGERLRRTDALLGTVSAVLLPLGLVLIGLGWYGAAQTPYLFEQVPYLISGGLLGLALVLGSGLLYFGSWVARAAQEQRAASSDLVSLLVEIRDTLVQGQDADAAYAEQALARALPEQPRPARAAAPALEPAAVRTSGRSRAGGSTRSGSSSAARAFVATASGSLLHRADCQVVSGRTGLRAVDPDDDGLSPCRLCSPHAAR